jgi:hypothetical protein
MNPARAGTKQKIARASALVPKPCKLCGVFGLRELEAFFALSGQRPCERFATI